jgi:uncharacterized coiled-coil protein SlyX
MPTYETVAKQSEMIQELSSALTKALDQNAKYEKEIETLKSSVGILTNTIEILSNAAAANNIKTFGN